MTEQKIRDCWFDQTDLIKANEYSAAWFKKYITARDEIERLETEIKADWSAYRISADNCHARIEALEEVVEAVRAVEEEAREDRLYGRNRFDWRIGEALKKLDQPNE